MSRSVDDHCLVISYYVFVFLVTSAWNTTSLKLRFPTNVGTERGQASFASCICFYILGACVYPYRDQDLVWKPVCHCGEQSKQCKLEEMSNILLHLIDARSAWHTGFFAFTLQCETSIPLG